MTPDWTYGTILQHPGMPELKIMFVRRVEIADRANWSSFAAIVVSDRPGFAGAHQLGFYANDFYGYPGARDTWVVVG